MSVAQLQRSPMVLEDDEQPRLLSPGRTGSQGRLAHREDMKAVDVPVNYTTLSTENLLDSVPKERRIDWRVKGMAMILTQC